jgi:hypothetical protein
LERQLLTFLCLRPGVLAVTEQARALAAPKGRTASVGIGEFIGS